MKALVRENQIKYPSNFLLIAIIILLLGFWYALNISNLQHILILEPQELSLDQIRILEVVSGHAWETHGEEVNKAIKCLEDNGSRKGFKTSFQDKYGRMIPTNVWLCFDGKNWYGIITTTFRTIAGNKTARLVTAYNIAKNIFPSIDDFINYIGTKWNAREIDYVIEAGKILIHPK